MGLAPCRFGMLHSDTHGAAKIVILSGECLLTTIPTRWHRCDAKPHKRVGRANRDPLAELDGFATGTCLEAPAIKPIDD